MNHLEIFTPSEDDYHEICELHNAAYQKFLDIYSEQEKLVFKDDAQETPDSLLETAKTRHILAIRNDKNILGYVVFRKKNSETVWISSLYILPGEQGKGTGTSLLKKIEEFARSINCTVVALETHMRADWALNFYKKNNYNKVNNQINIFPFNKILDKPPVPNRPLLAKII